MAMSIQNWHQKRLKRGGGGFQHRTTHLITTWDVILVVWGRGTEGVGLGKEKSDKMQYTMSAIKWFMKFTGFFKYFWANWKQ